MKKVLIILGSDSDYSMMEPCLATLKKFAVPFEATVCSAHRSPQRAVKLAAEAREAGFGVIIAGAGLAAHLPGVLASHTILPVIGVPLASGALAGVDALLAEVQMPPGIPVATVAVGGAQNAAVLAAEILALADATLAARLSDYKIELTEKVAERDKKLRGRLIADGYLEK